MSAGSKSASMCPAAGERSDWGFARSPKWVISHIAVLALIVALLGAGLWQVSRHRERADRNELIRARNELAPVDVATLVGPDGPKSVGEEFQFRQVIVTGEYRVQDEVLIRNRTYNGAPGWWVLTPLITDDGWAVAVNRGWIPSFHDADSPRPGTEPPAGLVTIVGTIQPTREAEGIQVADPAEDRLSSLGRPDVVRLGRQIDYPLAPLVVQMAQPEPDGVSGAAAGAGQPVPLQLPPLDAGPHASYAVQWFIFAAIAIVGYPLVLRGVARGRAGSVPTDDHVAF